MKITKVDLLRCHLRDRGNTPLLCRIYTDEGIYGDGEAAMGWGGVPGAAFSAMKDLSRQIIGMDPLQHEVIWQKLYKGTYFARNGGPVIFAAISALDIALWDIKGKFFNKPVCELLGGKQRTKIKAYASQTQNSWADHNIPTRTPEDYAREAKKAVDAGYDTIKLDFFHFHPENGKFSDDEHTCLISNANRKIIRARAEAVRAAIGPDVDIILENHCYTDAITAIQEAELIKDIGILYFEEPTTPEPSLLKYVHEQTHIPVASGERIYTRWQYNRFFQAGAIQYAQPDLGTCGGITEVKKICDLAYIYDVAMQLHVCGGPILTAATLQLEAAIPNFAIHEQNVWSTNTTNRELGINDYQPVNGEFAVPDLAGIGNEISDIAYRNADLITVD